MFERCHGDGDSCAARFRRSYKQSQTPEIKIKKREEHVPTSTIESKQSRRS